MSSFINHYKSVLDELQGHFLCKNKKNIKIFIRNLLKQTIFLAFYLKTSSQNPISEKDEEHFLESDYFWSALYNSSSIKRVVNAFFPLDLELFGSLKRNEKRNITSCLNDFTESYIWNTSQNRRLADNKDVVTPEIFEKIYSLENPENVGVVVTPPIYAYWMVERCFQRHLSRILGIKNFNIKLCNSLNHKQIKLLLSYISQIRVLDIAVGCGTFYLASLRYLQSLKNEIHIDKEDSFSFLMRVLKENLYGVDVDENALLVCKIRLTLQLLSENPLIAAEELLEIISNVNLRTGNSLMGFIENPDTVGSYGGEDYNKLIFRNIEVEDIQDTSYKRKAFHWFHEFPEIFDNEKPGFDIVIGNPPYIGYRLISQIEKRLLKCFYPRIYTGLNDYYYYFIWRATQLLASNGSCTLIVPRYFLEARYARKLRSQLENPHTSYIDIIIDLREFKVFPKGINTLILFLTKDNKSDQEKRILVLKKHRISSQTLLQELQINLDNSSLKPSQNFHQFVFNSDEFVNGKILSSSRTLRKKLKVIEEQCVPLGHLCDVGTGYHSGKDMVFSQNVIEQNNRFFGEIKSQSSITRYPLEAGIIKEIVKTPDILSFTIRWNNKYVILTERGIKIDDYPYIKTYLEQFKETLQNRYEVKKNLSKWYEIAQVRNRHLFKAKTKIICPYRARVPRFAIDEKQRFSSIDCTSIVPKKTCSVGIYYILGILNSELIEFYLYIIAKKLDAQKIELYPKTISQIPIKIGNGTEEFSLIEKISQITQSICQRMDSIAFAPSQKNLIIKRGKRALEQFAIDFNEIYSDIKQLDKMVYTLYGFEDQVAEIKREITLHQT